ncbi:MAG TPA: 16S rRNA (cytosine(967)-C(5))-methyltransferase RsmB [Candidatus Binatia bacterium]|nr:16S rRNA (cytosine(967)-C(5))-methyltransferase RsmB [Candidatus Binatia bacterium]
MIVSSEKKRKNVRQLASEILSKVDTRKAYADVLLDYSLKDPAISDRDRALLTELTYGTLRWRGKIDARLILHCRRSLEEADPFVRNLLRVTFYQLLFLGKIPDYAAVNEAVMLAKAYGGDKVAGFVNAVLRNFLREKDKTAVPEPSDDWQAALATEHSHPQWLVRQWLDYFGREEAVALMSANNEIAPLMLRLNSCRTSRDALLSLLSKQGIAAVAARWSPVGIWVQSHAAVDQLPGFQEGLFQVQGEASQLVSYLLSPQKGERILDACAAPGGKTTHIAELMADSGELIALDKSEKGIAKIRENAARLGLASLRLAKADVSHSLAAEFSLPYDRILVDAPCSGLGTLRSHPEIKWHRNQNDIKRLSHLQKNIVDRVAEYLKLGGVFVYSTCTLTEDENEKVVEDFLGDHKEFALEDAADYLPEKARSLVRGRYYMALPHRHNTDGFFAARMRKVAE